MKQTKNITANRRFKWILIVKLLLILTVFASLLSLATGEYEISLKGILETLYYKFTNQEHDETAYMIISQLRWPRVVLGLAIGGSLSLAGCILQGIYRNPLVEPYTLGISGGAALGVSICIITGLNFHLNGMIMPLAGFTGATVIIAILYLFNMNQKKVNAQQMLLTGVMISFISSSLMMLLMSIATDEGLKSIIFWTMGSLDQSNSTLIYTCLIVSILGLIASYLWAQPLNTLRLGSNKAAHLGVNVESTIKYLFIIASILTGVAVSVVGIIGFVGLIIPQLMRILVGRDYRILLVSSFLAGSIFLILCDTLARTIVSPNELPVGVITGIIGGSIFIVIMARQSSKSKM